jgi:hypothetical protein
LAHFQLHPAKLKWSQKTMNKTNKYIVLVVAGLLLLADKAMAFPNALAFATTPDGGSTALLLVAGLGGLALLRRFGRTK